MKACFSVISFDPYDVSGDGQLIAFAKLSSNPDAADYNVTDAFVFDRSSGKSTQVTIGTDGGGSDGTVRELSISRDGRFIGFNTNATNLAAPYGDDRDSHFYVFDGMTQRTWMVDTTYDGGLADRSAYNGVITPNGSSAVFASSAIDLTAELAYPPLSRLYLTAICP